MTTSLGADTHSRRLSTNITYSRFAEFGWTELGEKVRKILTTRILQSPLPLFVLITSGVEKVGGDWCRLTLPAGNANHGGNLDGFSGSPCGNQVLVTTDYSRYTSPSFCQIYFRHQQYRHLYSSVHISYSFCTDVWVFEIRPRSRFVILPNFSQVDHLNGVHKLERETLPSIALLNATKAVIIICGISAALWSISIVNLSCQST